jgi:adenine deaminase
MSSGTIRGRIIDVHSRRTFDGVVEWHNGIITSITEVGDAPDDGEPCLWIMPGFVDAHIHVESSMLVPSEFARIAVTHGTVATVSDPHEIANVCGIEGVRFMIDDGARTPLKFAFGAPSCVPATSFETAGAEISADDIRELFADERVRYLSEMMNWPGVLSKDPVVVEKIAVAQECGRVVDGHAPGLRGAQAEQYASLGISTDHECSTLEEACDKLAVGMKILIREGSAARNFEALHTLLTSHPESVMLCSDDMHPDQLVLGHINVLVARACALGHDLYNVLRAASVHPVDHYGLPVGQLRVGDAADFIVVDDLTQMSVSQTWIDGVLVSDSGVAQWTSETALAINNFVVNEINLDELRDPIAGSRVRVIVAHDGELFTTEEIADVADAAIQKIVVINRYAAAPPAIAYIKNIGLRRGAFASTVAHDSHNIIACGVSDDDILKAVNAVIRAQGGISVSDSSRVDVLPLPVGGLMSQGSYADVAHQYMALDGMVKELGSTLRAPFMTLSFMALLVIPSLKLSDKGLFDGSSFQFCDVHL